ncbi:cation-transporting P-type ATPase [Mycolicibacterium sp.]|uniref:cation-transporting P-type ATPase n=2 Tax=Mycolicibacterium sp. TaxID=2320850 RepID=UPI003D0BD0EB
MAAVTDADPHHGLPIHELLIVLQPDPHRGLSREVAQARLAEFGATALPAPAGHGLLRRIAAQFHHPLIYVLLAAGAVTAVLGEYVDSAVIFGVVLINALVGFVQESRAEAALDSLRAMIGTQARVVRDAREHTIPSDQLVPGDLVLLEAGDKVPADMRLVRADELCLDESALTGESLPVAKSEVVLPAATPVADRRNMVYSGTLVTAGAGSGVVVATGAETEIGEIHRLVGATELLATPLTAKLASFSRTLTLGILAFAAVTFALGLLRRQDAAETFTAAVALAVGAIPEGLPAAVTITLAIGVARMAKHNAVIRRLPAVETLGSTTVICTDKTGTLTENRMTVRKVWTPDSSVQATGSGDPGGGELLRPDGRPASTAADAALRWTLLAGAACNSASAHRDGASWAINGDPTEAALLVAAIKAGLTPDRVDEDLPLIATIPFSSERQYMATLHTSGEDGHVALVKGAVERLLALSETEMAADGTLRPLDRSAVLAAAEQLAREGLRVLACGMSTSLSPTGFGDADLVGAVTFTGLQAMLDPPRPAANAAVAACREAGIAVKMITGDHAGTAGAIAAQVGLLDRPASDTVLLGSDLAELPSEELPDAVDHASVFARVSPEQKLRLVEALQAKGHIVAMTGDGVNDAPALRQASIGVAMGRGGTEVAKDAADMVLTDDDFATIEAAVEEGRGVFDNLTKFIAWTLPTNIGEGLVILVAIALGTVLPILPTQILWINMTTAVALGLTLAFEPKETGIMTRPPRDPAEPLLTRALVGRILLVAGLLVAGSWWLFEWELAHGATLAEARTAALNLFVVVQAFYLLSCRSLTRSAWRIGLFTNRWLVLGVAVQAGAQLAITYTPVLNAVFQTTPLDAVAWLRIAGIAVCVSLVVAVDKLLRSRARLRSLSAAAPP